MQSAIPSKIRKNKIKDDILTSHLKRVHVVNNGSTVTVMKKACCVCDILLHDGNSDVISRQSLAERKWQRNPVLSSAPANFFQTEYRVPEVRRSFLAREEAKCLDKLSISPRTVITQPEGIVSLSICKKCKYAKARPSCSIVDLPIGHEPPIIECLNDVEVAVLNIGRVSGNIFQIFAGSHQSIKLFNQIHVNNTSHTMASLNCLQAANISSKIYCILSGPFTSRQREIALKRTEIDIEKVIAAFKWLKINNIHYKDMAIPDHQSLPKPIVLDHSHEEQSGDTNIEKRVETTVLFPEAGDIDEGRGDHRTTEQLLQEVLSTKSSERLAMISKPTKDLIKTWKPEEFVKTFLRQFPYGLGCKPPTMHTDVYLKHLLNLSSNAFHRADFILVTANIFFKAEIVRNASMKCRYKTGDRTAAERFNEIDADELDMAIDRTMLDEEMRNTNLSYFVRNVFAVSRVLPFSDEIVKEERQKIFSYCTQFGLPTGLLTVTPDDSDNFNMRIHKLEHETFIPKLRDANRNMVKQYLSECEQIRVQYPGYAQYEFERVMHTVISNVFGWDEDAGYSKAEGGIFGRLNAWCMAVEEQGRKTLHGHFLIWAANWEQLLKKAQDHNESVRVEAVCDMKTFMEEHVSTECFGKEIPLTSSNTNQRGSYSIQDLALKHECSSTSPSFLYPCKQDLRHMRFKHCPNDLRQMQIVSCAECDKMFTVDDLKHNTLGEIFSEKMDIDMENTDRGEMMRYIISISQCGIKELEADIDDLPDAMRNTLIHIHRNLHKQRHTFTCFKKGCECRAKIPALPTESATCEFIATQPMVYYDWKGNKCIRPPFRMAPKRNKLDVFTNKFHPFISEVFHCNSNFQCGIDGAGIMYLTCYPCKSTLKEDKELQLRVLLSLKKIMNKELVNMQEFNAPCENPKVTAFKKIFCSTMASYSNHTLCVPMAKHLVLHGSRFHFSHKFTYLPLYDLLKGATSLAKVDISMRNKLFLSSRRDTYLYRPAHMEAEDPMSFYAKFQVCTRNKMTEKNPDCFRFRDDAPPGYKNLCLMEREVQHIPIVNHNMFQSASTFGQNILDETVPTNEQVELHCQKLLLLFCSYRSEKDVLIGETFKQSFIMHFRQKNHNENLVRYMQNIQDCRNSLDSKRTPDELEESTAPLAEPESSSSKKRSRKPTDDVLATIDAELSVAIGEVTDTYHHLTNRDTSKIDLSKLTSLGAWDIGTDQGLVPAEVSKEDIDFVCQGTPEESSGADIMPQYVQKSLRKDYLFSIQKSNVYRESGLSEADKNCTKNISANGSCESILAWSKAAFRGDEDQSNAFQSLIGDFVLQHLMDATSDHHDGLNGSRPTQIRQWENGLKALRGVENLASDKRVIMFLTGPGGSGKSHVIHNIIEYGRQYTEKIGLVFTKQTIVVTALTGVAATSIYGETVHSALGININGSLSGKGEKRKAMINAWESTKLLIVDEISFAGRALLKSMADAIERLREKFDGHYGGLTVCFAGDFSQLEPVNGIALYKGLPLDQWHVWVNAFVELKGGHRYTDIRYNNLLTRLRTSRMTEDDYKLLSTRVVDKNQLSVIPPGAQIACASNRDRCAMNNLAFQAHLRKTHVLGDDPKDHTMIVRMDEMKWTDNNKEMNEKARHAIYEEVADHEVKRNGKFVDTFLKLYQGCPVMLTENVDVKRGIANGTVGKVKQIILNADPTAIKEVILIDGYKVNSVGASSVERIVIEIVNPDKTKRLISMEPQTMTATAYMKIENPFGSSGKYDCSISGKQFTFVVNHATTVHKLQGQTIDHLYIVNWTYSMNWVYVALSRVKSLAGLFLRKEIDRKRTVEPFSDMKSMIADFRSAKRLRYTTDDFVFQT